MVMSRTSFPKDLEPGLNTHFGLEYANHPTEWSMIFNQEPSNKAFEEDVLSFGFGAAPIVGEGEDYPDDHGGQGWSQVYVHNKIALKFGITEEAIDDNLYQSQGPAYARELARALQHTKEIQAASVLNNGFTSYTTGDGQPLLDTAHPLAGGGTFNNELTTPANLSEVSLEDVLILVRKAVNDRLVPKALMPKYLVVPPELEYDALRLTRSAQRPGTADNDVNAVRAKGIFNRDPVVITRLSSSTAWFVTTDCPQGLKLIQRRGVRRGQEQVFNTKVFQYSADERYSVGVTDPRGIWGTPGV